jgi:hypothetical protein
LRPYPIPVSEGCEYGKPPDTISRGALRIARNYFYEPENPTLVQYPWRSLFGTMQSGKTPAGLSVVRFRSGSRFLMGAAGTKIVQAPLGTTGTFQVLKTLTQQVGRMDFAYYNLTDRLYMTDGVNPPQVWNGVSGSTRDMGLNAPTTAMTSALVSNADTTYQVGDTFSYVMSEYDSVNVVESGPGPVIVVSLTTNGQTVRLNLPAALNVETTHLNIYRTQAGGTVWYFLARVPIGTLRYYDGQDTEALGNGSDNLTQYGFATMDDLFISGRQVMPMIGEPLQNNYVTQNGVPPLGDMATIFQDCLCISGVPAFPQHIYYSLPFLPESFSPVYFLAEENDQGDPVTGMCVANDRFLAFCNNSVWRHDRLPFVNDPGFGTGSATRSRVANDHGSIAKRAVCSYSVGFPNDRAFYLSNRGPYSTDGYVTVPLGGDLNWDKAKINFSAISGAVAVAWPKYRIVILCLPSPSSSVNDFALIYHYDPRHAKRGTGVGKWTGPIDLRAVAMAVSHDADTETRLYTADSRANGQVYLEDNGDHDAAQTLNSAGDILAEWETGDQVVGGRSSQNFLGNVYVSMADTNDTNPTLLATVNRNDDEWELPMENLTPNQASLEGLGTSSVSRDKGRTLVAGIWEMASEVRLHMKETSHGTRRRVVDVECEAEPRGRRK